MWKTINEIIDFLANWFEVIGFAKLVSVHPHDHPLGDELLLQLDEMMNLDQKVRVRY
jgi:hypothetical protein